VIVDLSSIPAVLQWPRLRRLDFRCHGELRHVGRASSSAISQAANFFFSRPCSAKKPRTALTAGSTSANRTRVKAATRCHATPPPPTAIGQAFVACVLLFERFRILDAVGFSSRSASRAGRVQQPDRPVPCAGGLVKGNQRTLTLNCPKTLFAKSMSMFFNNRSASDRSLSRKSFALAGSTL